MSLRPRLEPADDIGLEVSDEDLCHWIYPLMLVE